MRDAFNNEQASFFYEKNHRLFERLIQEVRFVLINRIEEWDIKLADIVERVKSRESFLEKIARKQYSDLHQVTDFGGVRVVCLFEPDVSQVAAIVNNSFDIDEVVDKIEDLGDDRMGYQGLHFLVRFGANYSGARYDELRGLRCEVQIRTVLQDAWAQISHHLAYKSEASIPRPLQRSINRVSTLLEIAQETFDRVRGLRREYVEEVEAARERESGFLCQPIDHETLLVYTRWKFPDLDVKTSLQEILLADLDRARFRTLQDIDLAVTSASDAVQSYQRENPELFKSGTDYLTKSLGFVDHGFRMKHGFSRKTRDAFDRHADKVVHPTVRGEKEG